MPINEEIVRATIERKLSQWVDSLPNPEEPIIGTAGSGEALSPLDILSEVKNRTNEGNHFVERWHQMALEHIMNSSLDSGDEEELAIASAEDSHEEGERSRHRYAER
jgi:hypothetical protein